jgi:DNA-binding GntR family transcriptional regulator
MSKAIPRTHELVDEIAAAIRHEVTVGRFPMGSRLRQEALASQFGVSRTPVREALRQLQAEGLVVVNPRRGALVRGPSPREIREAYRVRADLEGLAAELAAMWIDDAELRQLRQAEQRFNDVVRSLTKAPRPDPRRVIGSWIEANDRFHELIQQAARNETLRRTIRFLHRSIPRGLSGSALVASSSLLKQNAREHAGLRKAIEAHDGASAHVLMRDHIVRSGELAASYFELQQESGRELH